MNRAESVSLMLLNTSRRSELCWHLETIGFVAGVPPQGGAGEHARRCGSAPPRELRSHSTSPGDLARRPPPVAPAMDPSICRCDHEANAEQGSWHTSSVVSSYEYCWKGAKNTQRPFPKKPLSHCPKNAASAITWLWMDNTTSLRYLEIVHVPSDSVT